LSRDGSCRLTVVGDVCIDLVMGPVANWPKVGTETIMDRTEMRAGGSGGNAALAMRALGTSCTLVSETGSDAMGRWLTGQFDDLDARLTTVQAATSVTVGIIHDCGERTLFTSKGHLEEIEWSQLKPLVKQAQLGDIALLTGAFLLPRMRREYATVIAELRQMGFKVAIDTGWPSEGWTDSLRAEVTEWLRECDYIFLNELELLSLSGEASLESAALSVGAWLRPDAFLIAKMGPHGARAWQGSKSWSCPAPSVSAFDTIGAGDSFNAGCLAALLAGQSIGDAIQSGCRTASRIISQFPRSSISPGDLVSENTAIPA